MLELLGSVGTASLWPGWTPPTPETSAAGGSSAAATAGSAHRQALLFTRAAAMLAVEWPDAVQRCRLSAADFADATAAEAALLRLVAAAEQPEQLRLLLRLLGEVLPDDVFPTAAAAQAAAAEAEAAAEEAAAADEPETGPAGEEAGAAAAAAQAAATAETAASPMHRAWAACLQSLLAQWYIYNMQAHFSRSFFTSERGREREKEETTREKTMTT